MEKNTHVHMLGSYVIGFVLSLAMTIIAYTLVVNNDLFDHTFVVIAIISLALMQFVAQLLFFLHLGKEQKPWWKSHIFAAAVVVVAILVFGSLWIMDNLDYNMQHDNLQKNEYMKEQDRL